MPDGPDGEPDPAQPFGAVAAPLATARIPASVFDPADVILPSSPPDPPRPAPDPGPES